MDAFEKMVRNLAGNTNLCEAIIAGYHAYLESEEAAKPAIRKRAASRGVLGKLDKKSGKPTAMDMLNKSDAVKDSVNTTLNVGKLKKNRGPEIGSDRQGKADVGEVDT